MDKRVTIYDIAKKTGLTPGYISNLERGQRSNPSKTTMKIIAEALGKSVPEIFFADQLSKKGDKK